jgi:hypothetical protein
MSGFSAAGQERLVEVGRSRSGQIECPGSSSCESRRCRERIVLMSPSRSGSSGRIGSGGPASSNPARSKMAQQLSDASNRLLYVSPA